MCSFTIGMAGHIDHGKTALVKAITGIDTDTLKEERERGITIDIGFAHWDNGVTFIDVPGHERFIRNMVAGVNSIDYALLVIAADDGIMPQTREHLDIMKWLGIRAGAVVITKSDRVAQEKISVLTNDIKSLLVDSFLNNAPVFTVSVKHADSLEPLKAHLRELSQKTDARNSPQSFRMFIDRVFQKAGYGTVVTGTAVSGRLKTGDPLLMYPQAATYRVRGIQVRYAESDSAEIGDRAAINLTGTFKDMPERGCVLVQPDAYEASTAFYARVTFGKSVKPFSAMRLLTGTAELFARLATVKGLRWPEQDGFVLIRLNLPLPLAAGDRFVLREKNATATIGGGIIAGAEHLCAVYQANKTNEDFFSYLSAKNYPEVFRWLFYNNGYIDLFNTGRITGIRAELLVSMIQQTIENERFRKTARYIISQVYIERLKQEISEKLRHFHNTKPSMSGIRIQDFILKDFFSSEPELFSLCIDEMAQEGAIIRNGQEIHMPEHQARFDIREEVELDAVERLMIENFYKPPSPSEIAALLNISEKETLNRLHRLMKLGKAVKTDDKIFFHESAINRARYLLIDFVQKNNHISFQDFKQLTGASRKYVLALLEYFDKMGLTERNGEHRILINNDKGNN